MAYSEQQMSANRMTAIIGVGVIHAAIGYALVTGLAYQAFEKVTNKIEAITVAVQPLPEELPPPPPDKAQPQMEVAAPLPNAPAPVIDLSLSRPAIEVTTSISPFPLPPITPSVAREALAGPVASPSPPPSLSRGLAPDNQGRWARQIQDSYPARAIRDGTQGRVGVTVQVGANGRVTGCSVSSSSGSPVLDDAACKGMERFARFTPALNDAGNAMAGSYSTVIVYQLQ